MKFFRGIKKKKKKKTKGFFTWENYQGIITITVIWSIIKQSWEKYLCVITIILNDWAIKICLLKENSEIQGGGKTPEHVDFLNCLVVVLKHKTCSKKIFVDKVLKFI